MDRCVGLRNPIETVVHSSVRLTPSNNKNNKSNKSNKSKYQNTGLVIVIKIVIDHFIIVVII